MQKQITHIAILAGGRSRRMGQNKARLIFNEQILLARLIEDAKNLNLEVLLCADDIIYPEVENKTTYSPDLLTGKSGALSAIQPALEFAKNQGAKWLWVYACDSLVRPSELYPFLQRGLHNILHHDAKAKIILPKSDYILPLLGLFSVDLHRDLRDYLSTGQRRVMQFCRAYKSLEIQLPDSLFNCCNFNTLQEYELGKKDYIKFLNGTKNGIYTFR